MTNQLFERGYVVYHEEMGIYLGECLGMGFWTKLDPVGQPAAITFDSIEDAKKYLLEPMFERDERGVYKESDFRFVEVDRDDKDIFASIVSCVAAGLPSWNPDEDVWVEVQN